MALTVPAAAQGQTVLSSGHVDAVAARLSGGRLVSTLKDGTRGGTVWRDPDTVTLRVVPKAAFTVPAGMSFVGRRGSRAWLIPQAQRSGVIWAGWNTEAISSSAVRGGIGWTLTSVRGPGKVVIFQTGSFGQPSIIFDSGRRLPQTTTIAAGTHVHANWAFTRAGTYRFSYRLTARTRAGKTTSDSSTLTFRVG